MRAARLGPCIRHSGKHTIKVVAVGANGSVDPTPATLTVRVVKKKAPHPRR